MREILPVEQKQHREQRQMITREQVIMHQQNLVRIRAEIPKRKMHRQRVNPAKKKVKKILASTGIGIALGLAFFYALASDTYEPPKAEPRMVRAIGGEYYYQEDQYDEYLKERAAYIEREGNRQW